MKNHEEASMAELGMTPERLAERRAKLAADRVIGGTALEPGGTAKASETIPAPLTTPTGRRRRTDAGKPKGPRDSFYVSIPGVRWDLAQDGGREAFNSWIQLTYGDVALTEMVSGLIDRLRAR
jgi:hypothetical protein